MSFQLICFMASCFFTKSRKRKNNRRKLLQKVLSVASSSSPGLSTFDSKFFISYKYVFFTVPDVDETLNNKRLYFLKPAGQLFISNRTKVLPCQTVYDKLQNICIKKCRSF